MIEKLMPKSVAEWMLDEVARVGFLYQETAVYDISENFGGEFTYENESGNLAISKAVLTEFRKISEKSVVWERGERMWRKREAYDEPGRQQ